MTLSGRRDLRDLPSRAFGAGNERKYFEYLRTASGEPSQVKRVKEWILGEYKARQAQVA